jgi:hypothetical protein
MTKRLIGGKLEASTAKYFWTASLSKHLYSVHHIDYTKFRLTDLTLAADISFPLHSPQVSLGQKGGGLPPRFPAKSQPPQQDSVS